MHVLTMWQPWASAVARGSKRVETRSWSTDYRGPLAIHAAKRAPRRELDMVAKDPCWCGALVGEGGEPAALLGQDLGELLPFGGIIATCILSDCWPVEEFDPDELDFLRSCGGHPSLNRYRWSERQMGDFSPGRFGLVLTDVQRLKDPLPFTGRQAKLIPAPQLAWLR